MPRHLIIDGYNAIAKIRKLGEAKDLSLEASRTSFIMILKDFMSRRKMFDKVTVVFDNKREGLGVMRYSYGKIEAVFTTADRDADSVIIDMLRNASSPDRISVSSDDNFVRNHARAFGSEVISISGLEDIIMLKRKNFRGTIKAKEFGKEKMDLITKELKKHWGIE